MVGIETQSLIAAGQFITHAHLFQGKSRHLRASEVNDGAT